MQKDEEQYRSEYEHPGRIAYRRKYPDFERRSTYPISWWTQEEKRKALDQRSELEGEEVQ